MNSEQVLLQKDMFGTDPNGIGPLVLHLYKIRAPRTMSQKKGQKMDPAKPMKDNFHIPSFKNSKQWITKGPRGIPLSRPILITSPEFQRWMEKAGQSLELQCISKCLTAGEGTPVERSKLFAMLSLLPADDSVNDLRELHVIVERVRPGEEGATIIIERLT